MKKIGVIVIHGMGNEPVDFDAGLKARVAAELGQSFADVAWVGAHWAPVVQGLQQDLWERVQRDADLDWRKLRRFFLFFLADALAYQRYGYRFEPESTYERVQDVVCGALRWLEAELEPGAPLVALAHSQGAYVLTSYAWDRQTWTPERGGPDPRGTTVCTRMETLAGIVTFGCNLPFFSFGARNPRTIDFPGRRVSGAVRDHARWLNFYDADDILGWPIRNVYTGPEETLARIQDIQVDIGVPLVQSSNPLSHTAYWDDKDLVRPVAAYLRELLEALRPPG